MNKRAGDKFRQRIAFNLAKECLLGKKHNPSEPQVDLFMAEFLSSNFSDKDNKTTLDVRTYENGWIGKSKPHIEKQLLLDDIVSEYKEKRLAQWLERNKNNESIHDRKLHIAFEQISICEGQSRSVGKVQGGTALHQYSINAAVRAKKTYRDLESTGNFKDGITMSYYPGVDVQPSRWIKRNAINDVLHEHLLAIDIMTMEYSSSNIVVCDQFLNRIHKRWNPHGGNHFFEQMNFSQSDYIYLDEDVDSGKTNALISTNELYGTLYKCIERYKSPDNVYETYDKFSPLKICDFLISIPFSKDISKHPLLDFWLLEFASATAGFHWLSEKTHGGGSRPMEVSSTKLLDNMSFGYELLWGNIDVAGCLSFIDIYPSSVLYISYHAIFSKIRTEYKSILKRFGIDVSELQMLLKNYRMGKV